MDFESLCAIYGYYPEEHIVQTKDGFMLGVHRLPNKKGLKGRSSRKGRSVGKPVVYLHHGTLEFHTHRNTSLSICDFIRAANE